MAIHYYVPTKTRLMKSHHTEKNVKQRKNSFASQPSSLNLTRKPSSWLGLDLKKSTQWHKITRFILPGSIFIQPPYVREEKNIVQFRDWTHVTCVTSLAELIHYAFVLSSRGAGLILSESKCDFKWWNNSRMNDCLLRIDPAELVCRGK